VTTLHYKCSECGPHVAVDEDGCCVTCGRDCKTERCGGHVCGTLLTSAQARIAELEAAILNAVRCETMSGTLDTLLDALYEHRDET